MSTAVVLLIAMSTSQHQRFSPLLLLDLPIRLAHLRQPGLLQILKSKILHRVRRHQIPLHPALQIPLTQRPTLVVIDSFVRTNAAQVLLHDGLTFGIVVEREGAALGWGGLGESLRAAWAAKGRHCRAHVDRKA